MITEAISVFAIRLLEKAGYLGAGVLMGLESMKGSNTSLRDPKGGRGGFLLPTRAAP